MCVRWLFGLLLLASVGSAQVFKDAGLTKDGFVAYGFGPGDVKIEVGYKYAKIDALGNLKENLDAYIRRRIWSYLIDFKILNEPKDPTIKRHLGSITVSLANGYTGPIQELWFKRPDSGLWKLIKWFIPWTRPMDYYLLKICIPKSEMVRLGKEAAREMILKNEKELRMEVEEAIKKMDEEIEKYLLEKE